VSAQTILPLPAPRLNLWEEMIENAKAAGELNEAADCLERAGEALFALNEAAACDGVKTVIERCRLRAKQHTARVAELDAERAKNWKIGQRCYVSAAAKRTLAAVAA